MKGSRGSRPGIPGREDPSATLERLRPWVKSARAFTGWDLASVSPTRLGTELPWDYERLVRESAQGRDAVVDLGTGGGEVLSKVRDGLPARVVATESWSVNAPLAARRLAPLGVRVVRCDSLRLPFRDSVFDLVIDRHEEFEPDEVDRVLAPGGRFLTQQVGRSDWHELRPHFPRMVDFGDLRPRYEDAFRARGYLVEGREQDSPVAYGSLGEVVFMLAVAPWTIPDFDLEGDLHALRSLEAACTTKDGLVLTESRFLLVADKPP
jgi:SAM-dependent methyltransferase